MVDPVLPAIANAASQLPAATKSRTVRNILKVLGLWAFPQKTLRAIDDLADLDSRDTLRKALDKAAAEKIASDPEVVARYAARISSDAYLKQHNLEEISRMAVEEIALQEDNGDFEQDSENADIDDGWRLKYTSFAEGVTDQDLQRVWARVLAGEIRTPGSFSFQSMRILAEIDTRLAMIFSEMAKHVIAGNAIHAMKTKEWGKGDLYLKITALQNSGLVSERAGQSNRELRRDTRGRYFVYGEEYGAMIYSPSGPESVTFPIIQLTESGKQLFRLLHNNDELTVVREICNSLSDSLKQAGGLCLIGPRRFEGELTYIDATEYLWGAPSDRSNIPPR